MKTTVVDGNSIASHYRIQVKDRLQGLRGNGASPRLDVILVGSRPDSLVYVEKNARVCEEIGITHKTHVLPDTTSQTELESLLNSLAADASVHGIILQLPLPSHLNSYSATSCIPAAKDVDGLTDASMASVYRAGASAPMIPCTPLACIKILQHHNDFPVEGRKALVVGRSTLVGKPMAHLLLSMGATVTVAHSQSVDLEALVGEADIVVVAVGRIGTVKGSWMKHGSFLIDVGINATENGIAGDVEWDGVEGRCAFATPVPGGVGPVTVAMLAYNTLEAFIHQHAHIDEKDSHDL
jgi:methylenetetrahydrofolate dehydrogenase (NADP+)/methenyltetrahydrofolate cyclohydrolase